MLRVHRNRPTSLAFLQSPAPSVHTPNNSRGTRLTPHASHPNPWTLPWAIGQASPCPSLEHHRGPILGPRRTSLYLVQIWAGTKQGASDTCSWAHGAL